MPKGLWRQAGAGLAVALVYIFAMRVLPKGGAAGLCIVVGLVAAGVFVWIYVRRPPSLQRFRWLCASGLAAASALGLATVLLILQFPLGLNRLAQLYLLTALVCLILVGVFVFTVWHYLALRSYHQPKPPNPDFEEDAEGNPVRPRDPDTDPGD